MITQRDASPQKVRIFLICKRNNEKNVEPSIYRVFIEYCVFFNNLRYFSTSPYLSWSAIGCTENGQSIRVTVHSDLRSDELLSSMQGMGCCELRKIAIFNEHPVPECEYTVVGQVQAL